MNKKIISIVLILILISLNISFFIFNNTNKCKDCKINFTQNKMSGTTLEHPRVYSYSPFELYDSLLNNTCPITWDRTGGYHANRIPEVN